MSGVAHAQKGEADLWATYQSVRSLTERLAAPLSPEDQMIQSMPDASPTKWHLAHTSWFFETFILAEYCRNYQSFNENYRVLFNSYYNGVGEQYSRPKRGMISRPGVAEVLDYRRHVDDQLFNFVGDLLQKNSTGESQKVVDLLVLGINHEQQHQELILTDIKHALFQNPANPVYCPANDPTPRKEIANFDWKTFDAGIYQVGHAGDSFHFDNETPQHRVFQEGFSIAKRLATNAEYLEFINDGGYENPSHWLSEGWTWIQEQKIRCPLYWSGHEGNWDSYTLAGRQELRRTEPVIHLSYFEADAFARWAGYRLPTEQEWEIAALQEPLSGHFLDPERCHPVEANSQYFGNAWCWTSSAYSPYPGFETAAGAVGEYNGKFMSNQYVLRGGSCATPEGHVRPTYRNFFPAHARWQFSGLRFAKDV